MKTQRNDPCPCGSGKKFKKCCQGAQEASAPKVVLPSGETLDKLPEPQKGKSLHHHGHVHGPACGHAHRRSNDEHEHEQERGSA